MNIFPTRLYVLAVFAVALVPMKLTAAPDSLHEIVSCDQRPVAPLGEQVSGKARLCFTRRGVIGSMNASGLAPGDAYTLWLVYIDDPSVCDPSTLDCFDDENPEGVFGRFDSAVAEPHGKFHFVGRANGMVPSPGALFFLLLYTHGKADYSDGRALARQLLTPEDPAAGVPHLGNLVDGPRFTPAAIAVFAVP